jgi:RNA polymerase sigma-70 factor (ECF subfamily)
MTVAPNGSGINWTAALNQHGRWLRSVLRSRVQDSHAVDDLFQELSLAVVRQSSRPTDARKVAPWLYRLAVRYSINHHRRNGRRRRLRDRLERDAIVAGSAAPDALDWLLQRETVQAVRKALSELRPSDREILVLKYTEHWSYADLARHLGASAGTIEYRLVRARKALRKRLCAQDGDFRAAGSRLSAFPDGKAK